MKKMSRNRIRIISYTAALIAVLTIFGVRENAKAEYYRQAAVTSARQAAADLAVSAEEISTALTKCALSPSDELTSMMCARLYGTCLVTSAALDALPWQHEMENLTAMLEEVELFALESAQTGKIDKDALTALQRDVENASALLTDAYNSYQGGWLSFGSSSIDPYHSADEDDLGDRIGQINDSAASYAPNGTGEEAQEVISANEARAKAARLLGCELEDVSCDTIKGSRGTVYSCSSGDIFLGIDAIDGNIVSYTNLACSGGEGCSPQDALRSAVKFIKDTAGIDVESLSYRIDDGFMRCTMTGRESDMYDIDTPVSVMIDLSDGSVAAFDLSDYHAAADERKSITLGMGESESAIELPPQAQPESRRFCLIRMPWSDYRLCEEYTAVSSDGSKYVIYYDAATGAAIDLRTVSEDEGSLTIS